MNLGQMRTMIRTRIGSPSAADVPDTPNLDGHINDAYQEIFNKYKFKRRRERSRFTTTIGANKYNISGITDVVYKAWDRTNGRELTYVGVNDLASEDYDSSPNNLVQNAKPVRWTHTGSHFQLLPPPDGAYVIELYHKVLFTTLVNSGDVPVIPANWHRGIVILGSHMYYDDEAGDPVKALYHLQKFKDWASDQPVESHEETEAIDSGVEVPTLAAQRSSRRPDGIWWDALP